MTEFAMWTTVAVSTEPLWLPLDTIVIKMGQPRPLFVYFRSFQIQLNRKIVDFSGIRTRIVGKHADHLTNTTAL